MGMHTGMNMPVVSMAGMVIMGIVVPVVVTEPVIVVPVVMLVVMSVFGEAGKPAEGTIELSGTAQECDAGEHGDVDELTCEVADGEPEQEVATAFGRGD